MIFRLENYSNSLKYLLKYWQRLTKLRLWIILNTQPTNTILNLNKRVRIRNHEICKLMKFIGQLLSSTTRAPALVRGKNLKELAPLRFSSTFTVPSAAVTFWNIDDRPMLHPASSKLFLNAWGTVYCKIINIKLNCKNELDTQFCLPKEHETQK